MNQNNRAPLRSTEGYKNLSRSVAANHVKTEAAKKNKHISSNLLQNFFNSNWMQWLFHYLKSRFGPKHSFPTYEKSTDKGIYTLESINSNKLIKIALIADWATDTVESTHIGNEVRKHEADYSIHMGDTYFVGAPFEIENNFLPDNFLWPYGSVGSFALTGNHEMYSNGKAFFNKLLPCWMGLFYPGRSAQKASYFCLENDYWRIIGLDTGYRSVGIPFLEILFSKADLRPEIVSWLKSELNLPNDNRGLILLTHHQYASSFEKTYPAAAKQLAKLIPADKKVLWFWGHEHRFAMYGEYSIPDGITAYGRCIGHGGMPISLFKENSGKQLKESNLVLFDNRFCKRIEDTDVGHNGYAILNIEDEKLNIDYYDEHQLLVSEQWQYNKTKQMIEGEVIINHCPELDLRQDIHQAIQ
ncbi:MAG: metallophosphoesterase [Segetibacter sp.]|nr:metallophosphoesterase [Segetibacter sp.]